MAKRSRKSSAKGSRDKELEMGSRIISGSHDPAHRTETKHDREVRHNTIGAHANDETLARGSGLTSDKNLNINREALLTLSNALDKLQIPPPINPKTRMARTGHPESSGAKDGAEASDGDESQPLIFRRESMDRFNSDAEEDAMTRHGSVNQLASGTDEAGTTMSLMRRESMDKLLSSDDEEDVASLNLPRRESMDRLLHTDEGPAMLSLTKRDSIERLFGAPAYAIASAIAKTSKASDTEDRPINITRRQSLDDLLASDADEAPEPVSLTRRESMERLCASDSEESCPAEVEHPTFNELEHMSGDTVTIEGQIQDVFGASLDPAQTSGPEENVSRAVEKPSLSDIVAAVIEASSSSGPNKYFRPPPEARFMTNRNIYTRKEGPMASVAAYEQPIRPSDIQLDSTRCYSNFDPPIKFCYTEQQLHNVHSAILESDFDLNSYENKLHVLKSAHCNQLQAEILSVNMLSDVQEELEKMGNILQPWL